jgi:hypothetical protein
MKCHLIWYDQLLEPPVRDVLDLPALSGLVQLPVDAVLELGRVVLDLGHRLQRGHRGPMLWFQIYFRRKIAQKIGRLLCTQNAASLCKKWIITLVFGKTPTQVLNFLKTGLFQTQEELQSRIRLNHTVQ